jgi:hypothetical protein
MKIILVFQLHELVTSEDLHVTYLKQLHMFSAGQRSGSSIGEQACYSLRELPCGFWLRRC